MNEIYIQKTNNRKEFVIKVLKEIEEELKKANKILLKPNIVSHEPYPTTTHPEVLETCLEFILNINKEVLVADGPALDAGNSKKIIAEHHLKKACDKFGIPLIDLNSGQTKKIKTKTSEFNFSTIPFEYDFIISLPVLKAHEGCGITGALKNQFGLISPRDRIALHITPWKSIHKAIAEINLTIKPNFWIIDAVQTITGTNEVRHGGKIRELGYMLAGKDPVSLDIEGLKLLQAVDPSLKDKKPEDILHLKYAIEIGVGKKEYTLSFLK
jgi:uncharacterized protein (DUF362 family)